MSNLLLPNELKKFIAEQGYEFKDSQVRKTIKSKPSISIFQTAIFVILGLLFFAFGFVFELLYVLGVLIILVPLLKYLLRKRYVYEFDLQKGVFEIKDFLSPKTKKIFSFAEIIGVDINHYISNTEVSGYSNSNKEYNYEVVLKAGNKQEFELFYFAAREFNPQEQVVAIKSTIMNWLKPVAA